MNRIDKGLLEANVLMMHQESRRHFFVEKMKGMGQAHLASLRKTPIMRASQQPYPPPRDLDAKWRNGFALYAFGRLWVWTR